MIWKKECLVFHQKIFYAFRKKISKFLNHDLLVLLIRRKKSRVSRVAELKTGSLTKANSSASGMSRSNSVQAELSTAGGPPPPSTTTLKLEENFSLTPASCSYGAASPQISPKPASPNPTSKTKNITSSKTNNLSFNP